MPEPFTHTAGVASGWNYDMSACPVLSKVCLLTTLGIQIIGQIDFTTRSFYVAWGPLYKRDKHREAELGLKIGA